jgi:hypothetical protein
MVEVVRRLDEPAPAESAVAESAAAEPDVRGANRPGDRRRAARLRAEESTDSTPSEPTSPRTEAAVSARVPEPQLAAPPVVIAAVDPIETTAGMTAESVEQAAVIPDSPLRAAEPNQPPSASTSRSAPPTRDRKVIQRAEFPLISVYKTIWHPDVDRRVAIVELTESGEQLSLKQGDAVGPLVIETIRPSGVLFVHDGVEVEYRVGQ